MIRIVVSGLLLFLCGALDPARAQPRTEVPDNDWMLDYTALTLAPDGRWGTATEPYIYQAIAGAIANCTKSGKPGCGAYLSTIRAGWSLGLRCGDHIIVVAERTLADAERIARRRESQMRIGPASPCIRVVTVDPSGRVRPRTDSLSGRLLRR